MWQVLAITYYNKRMKSKVVRVKMHEVKSKGNKLSSHSEATQNMIPPQGVMATHMDNFLPEEPDSAAWVFTGAWAYRLLLPIALSQIPSKRTHV